MVGMTVPGYNPNAPYWQDGQWGTPQQHRERAERDAKSKADQAYQQQRARELAEQEQARNAARQESIRAAQTAASTNSGYQTNNQGLSTYGSGNPGSGGSGGSGGGYGGGSGGGSGGGAGADDWRAKLELQARLTQEAEARRWAMIQQAQNSMNSRGPITPPDFSAANAAAFARAKDMVGLQQRSAMNSLRDYYSGSGQSGLGAAGRATLGAGLDQLGEVTRDQAIADANRNADFAKLTYQGDIEQRQQNMQYMAQLLGLLGAQAY